MNESVIIQKLIQVGQMLERGELEYSSAEADIKHYLEQYAALRQTDVIESVCSCSKGKGIDYDEDGKAYCIDCGNYLEQTIP